MTREEAKARLEALNQTIATAVTLIRSEVPTLDQFFAEAQHMDSVGHILDPTLFNDSERRATAALLTPVYTAARDLVRIYDHQVAEAKSALRKVG